MPIVLFGHTAFEYWAHSSSRGTDFEGSVSRLLSGSIPTIKSVRHLERVLPYLSKPYHLLVGCPADRRRVGGVRCHVSSSLPQRGSLSQIEDGLYSSTPELCFVQMASGSPILQLVRDGYLLCGRYRVFSAVERGGSSRFDLVERKLLCRQESLERFAVRASHLEGSARARRVIPFVLENAASPAEISMAMRLILPYRLGGFGLPSPVLNARIELSSSAKQIAVKSHHEVDMLWPADKVVVEYDSNLLHLNSASMTVDAIKRGVLEEMGYKIVTVTADQLRDPELMRRVALRIGRRLSFRVRPRGSDFSRLQQDLFMLR